MISLSKLKDIREDNDISQAKMADILGVKRSTYSLWELGINIIPLKNLCDYADYFNMSLDYILGISKKKENKVLIKGLSLKTLGTNMKKIRLSHNLSQENVASILKVSQACIAKYEKGIISISTSNLCEFAKEFKVSINDLCGKS